LKFAVLWFCLTPAFAQGVITTVAGTDWLFPGDGRPALNAPLSGATGLSVTVDGSGNYYIADPGNFMAMRVGPDGILNVIAGNGVNFVSGDGGPGVNASLILPTAIAVDAAGNVFIAEGDSRVRKLTTDGKINLFAGTGNDGFAGDGGPATQALLNGPHGLAVDSAGNVYISDTFNNRVRKVTPDGTVVTVAGNGQQGKSGDNLPATSVPLNNPTRIAVDNAGNLYIVEFPSPDGSQNLRVRRVDAKGTITTVAPQSKVVPLAVTADSGGNLYILDALSQGVVKVDAYSGVTTIAGGSQVSGFSGDGGAALKALFNFNLYPDVTVDSHGNILIADDGNDRIREINPAGTIQTIAGNGLFHFSGDGGPATGATLDYPVGVIGDSGGNLYVAEGIASRVRRIAPDGTISVFAGKGGLGYSGDNGPAVSAALNAPMYMTFAPDGSLLVGDFSNCVIRSIDTNGIIRTVAGNGACTYFGDGNPAPQASFNGPSGMAYDSSGELVIADTYNNRLRVILADGTVHTVAGTGKAGFSGDLGSSLKAQVNQPVGVRIYNGAIYFSDYGNHRVRKIVIDNTLTITTVAGNGKKGYSGDGGPATQASLNYPQGITFDAAGNLYIADAGNRVVRKVDPSGNITTFAGSKSKVSGDGGPATQAGFGSPQDLWVDKAGDVLVTDAIFGRLRSVLVNPPSFSVSTNNLAFTATAGGAAVDQGVSVTGSIPGVPFTIATSANGTWLQVTPQTAIAPATMPTSVKITANPSGLSAGSYQGTVTINAPNAQPSQQTITVALTVAAAGQPSLSVKPLSLTFSYVRGAAAATRAVTVSNAGGGSLTFTAISASPWLKATPGNGTLGAFGGTPVNITADPTGLAPGVYSGTVVFSSVNPQQSVVVPVTMTVTAVQQTILIPQSGLTFYAVQGGGALLPQFFSILNTGVGTMQFTTSASTLSGGPWLSVFPSAGTSDNVSPVPQVRVDVTPGNLAAGVYYGTVQVTAPQADNTPQFVSVVLNVLPRGSKLGPLVQPAGLIYTAVTGGESPSSQTIAVQSTDSNPANFSSAFAADNTASWLTPLPAGGAISQAVPIRVVLQPQTTGLTPGVHRGTVTLSFTDGSTRAVSIVLVLVPPGSASSSSVSGSLRRPAAPSTCVPTTLAPVFTQLSSGFTVAAGFPGQVAVKVFDDCGVPMTGGSVNVSFSNGDAPLRLTSLRDGNWAATWTPQHTVSPITVIASAAIPEQSLSGETRIVGGLGVGTTLTVGAGGILNAASFAQQGPIAPGSYITIFGSQLAQGQASAPSVPLPVTLGGSSVVFAGQPAPLVFASDGQVNAIVPYGIAVNTTQQLIVSRGSSISVPQPITVAAAAPGIYTINGSGQGQGIIIGVNSAGVQTVADPSHPVHAGDTIVIYCTGLGEVNPPVAAGSSAPLNALSSTVNPVAVTIGGVTASVAFAGLTPGSAGLYQVNAVVPQGVGVGDQMPVVLTSAGQQSQPVTIAVR
jgi:uncharacterized protein (TIGR03437 family)